jgi:hypothetical protein
MEPTSIAGVFAGYELYSGCRWSGIYMVWSLEEFTDIDLSSKSSLLARKQRKRHKTKAIEMPKEGICFPLKSESDHANSTLEGLRQTSPPSLFELPKLEEATVRVVPHGDRWIHMGMHWMRIHMTPRDSLYIHLASVDGPDLALLTPSMTRPLRMEIVS